MDFTAFFNQEVFTIGEITIKLGRLIFVTVGVVFLYILGFMLLRSWLDRFFLYEDTTDKQKKRVRRLTTICLILIAALVVLLGLQADFAFSSLDGSPLARIKLSTFIQAFLIYFIARLVDELLSNVLTHRYQQRREQQLKEGGLYQLQGGSSQVRVSHIVQPIVYLLALTFIIQQLGLDTSISDFLPWTSPENAGLITINRILSAILILLVTRLILWVLTEIVLYPYYKQKEINVGSQYAINRLLTYFVLLIAVVGTLQYVGINLTVLMGGAAALLVGIGLGLQQTFNDLICGIILLFERTVEVGDIVDMNDLVGTVKKIGIRTSLVETRDNVSVIVPNSKLVADNVINWSHFDSKARFKVGVGVAYGSDTTLVKNILQEAAEKHNRIVRHPKPFVRFVNFGDSSLDFEILFWTRDLLRIEDVKSDLRFAIDKAFREADVSIPFPQRDLWIKQAPPSFDKED
ncbi:mechanosensitive ion channel family protein [Lewinella cohaerens]|uniref:mechanosensitive ion channel family protein n=1 Tax=Lewinella cohaerens TaxID=70995 RepID=UPI0003695774|nr:mechanosensitive ion channel domain-containing protein [Lewinella cohaerens]